MKIYCTTKNSGPSWLDEHKTIVYIGTSHQEAREAVAERFRQYQMPNVSNSRFKFPYMYSALPDKMPKQIIEFYQADGWWYSICTADIKEPTNSEGT
jgi:hypothetical protein